MERHTDRLAKAGSNAISKTRLKLDEDAILRALMMTAQHLKTDLAPEEIASWLDLLEPYPVAMVQKSFHQFLKRGQFFPKPAEIIEPIESYQRTERDRLAAEQRKAEKAETEAARARGEVWGWADVVKKFSSVLSTVTRRRLVVGHRMPNAPVAAEDGRTVLLISPEARRRAREQAVEAQRRFGGKA